MVRRDLFDLRKAGAAIAKANAHKEAALAALRLALPYVEAEAAKQPTEHNRVVRQRKAALDAIDVREAIAKLEEKAS